MNSIVKKQNKLSKRKGRQLDPSALVEVQKLLEALPLRKELLIEALHLIQDRYHYLSAKHTLTKLNLVRDSFGRKPPNR